MIDYNEFTLLVVPVLIVVPFRNAWGAIYPLASRKHNSAIRMDFRGYNSLGLDHTSKALWIRYTMEGVVLVVEQTSTKLPRLKTPLKAIVTLPMLALLGENAISALSNSPDMKTCHWWIPS